MGIILTEMVFAQVHASLISCTTQVEADLFAEIQKYYQTDAFLKPLMESVVNSITTAHGKYALINNIIHYIGSDERYLLCPS